MIALFNIKCSTNTVHDSATVYCKTVLSKNLIFFSFIVFFVLFYLLTTYYYFYLLYIMKYEVFNEVFNFHYRIYLIELNLNYS